MSYIEVPTHAQVAAALGCKPVLRVDGYPGDFECTCMPPRRNEHGYDDGTLMRYDTDWSATGPLIERMGIEVAPDDDARSPSGDVGKSWYSFQWSQEDSEYLNAKGPTPLIAVCNLILSLAAAGKLTPLLEASK